MHSHSLFLNDNQIPIITEGMMLETCGQRFSVSVRGKDAILRNEDSNQERICPVDDLHIMLIEGVAQLLPSGPLPASSVPAHFDPSNAFRIDHVPVSLSSTAAVAQWTVKVKWLQRIKRKGLNRFIPDAEFLCVLREIERDAQEMCPFKPNTLYKAHLQLRRNDWDYRCLLPQFARRGGAGKSRLPDEVEKIVDQVMNAAANPKFGLLQASRIYNTVAAQVVQLQRTEPHLQYGIPSLPTITRRMTEHFSAYDIAERKYGRKRAEKMFRQNGSRVRAERPLDVVEFDDKDTACFLIDERTQLPWGRAHLTAGVDQATSSVMGINLSERPRSTHSAWAAIEHAIYPKDQNDPIFAKCRHRWEPYGHMGLIVMDNATYNASQELQPTILEYGAEIEYARPHRPTDKSCIEHFNHRIISQFVCHLPGWAGPKENRESLDLGLKSAVYSLGEFTKNLVAWITDEYSNAVIPHLGTSPRKAWNAAFEHVPPHLPRKRLPIALAGTIRQEIRFRASGGLLRKELRYQSPDLAELQKHLGMRAVVLIRYAPNDLSSILVQDPRTNGFMRVPCIEDPRFYQDITDYQQSLLLKFRRMLKKDNQGILDIWEVRQRMIAETHSRRQSKSMRSRKLAVLAGSLPSCDVETGFAADATAQKISNVEKLVIEIDANELELEEYEVVTLDE